MLYSFRIEQAIRAAAILHKSQVRKGRAPYPYVAHLFAVAAILSDYTDDQDIIIAGLLHDSLEDTDYTQEELETDFGSRVREIVEGVSERFDPEDPTPFHERKRAYLHVLKKAPVESLLVAAADKIHNLRSIIEEYDTAFEQYLEDFRGTTAERLQFYEVIHEILNNRLENDIIHEFNYVYRAFKKFIEDHTEEGL